MKRTKPSPLSPLKYTDYRAFLVDYHERKRQQRPGWSLASWARQLGLTSSAGLVMILKGRRNPGPGLLRSLVSQIGMSDEEAEHFCDLVNLEKSHRDPRLSVLLMERLAKRRPDGKFRFLDHDTFRAVANWYYYAIREMVNLRTFREDPSWICRRLKFKISRAEAAQALTTLIQLGLLARAPDGRLVYASGNVNTPSEISSEGIQRFHRQSLQNAELCLQQEPPDSRGFYAVTFAMPMERLEKAKQLLTRFRAEFCELLEEGSSDAVFQLQVAFFPVATLPRPSPGATPLKAASS